MKTKITFLAILFSVLSFSQVGTVFTTGGINYKITSATTVEVSTNPTSLAGAIVIPETVSYSSANYAVKTVGEKAFQSCKGLTAVTIPSSATAISNFAFRYCSSLTSVSIPNTVTSIGAYAFGDCTNITAILIPNSVVSFGEGSFYMCSSLKSVIIPTSLTRLAPYSFGSCSELTEVIVPNSVKIIEEGAFFLCTKLSSVTIPNTVTSIGNNAFISCALKSISIPSSVTSIGNYAFEWCVDLTTVTIPGSVNSIGENAFKFCLGLTSVTVNWAIPLSINRNVFDELDLSKITLNVMQGTELVYKSTAVWKDFGSAVALNTNQFSVNTPVKFYPNPTQSQIRFTEEMNTLEVFDIAGKKVKSFQNPNTNYDVASLQNGVYILKGTTTDGKSFNEKLVKE